MNYRSTETGDLLVIAGTKSTTIPVGHRLHDKAMARAALPVDDPDHIAIEPYSAPTQAEIDAAQQDELDGLNTKVMDSDLALKAFALITLDAINTLRVKAGLAEITPLQLKSAHRAKLDTL